MCFSSIFRIFDFLILSPTDNIKMLTRITFFLESFCCKGLLFLETEELLPDPLCFQVLLFNFDWTQSIEF